MIRTLVQLTEAQLNRLSTLAKQEERSVADLVRQSVAEYLLRQPARDRTESIESANALIGRYRSGCPDLALHHDRYLEEAFDT